MPITKTIWRGKVGTPKKCACIVIVPVTSVPVTRNYCTIHTRDRHNHVTSAHFRCNNKFSFRLLPDASCALENSERHSERQSHSDSAGEGNTSSTKAALDIFQNSPFYRSRSTKLQVFGCNSQFFRNCNCNRNSHKCHRGLKLEEVKSNNVDLTTF